VNEKYICENACFMMIQVSIDTRKIRGIVC
jgi:hypothetical protein